MHAQSCHGLKYFQFEIFGREVIHAVFSRTGGVSPAPWASLNMGASVGDESSRVQENRKRAISALELDPASVYDAWQVHGTSVAVANTPHQAGTNPLQADIILTDLAGITLMMRFADCVPIFLHDPVRKVVGLVHAGWVGTVKGTVRVAVQEMISRFHCDPGNIRSALGPSIGPDHYQVGEDVIFQVEQAFGRKAETLLESREGSWYLDLWEANRIWLNDSGVERVEISGLCTACDTQNWFSHRAEKGVTGRFGALLALV